jgi:serine/threonine protein kinase
MVASEVSVGQVVLGKWRLDRCLGQGGMGTVYLARELSIDREVALKFLHSSLVELEEYRSRFEREARVMAQVEHPNLVTLYGVEHQGPTPFLVMKFVPGRPLARIKRGGPLPLVEVMPLVVQIAAALAALHARGFVHRDLKPGNVMVDDDGHVTVLDFGLTRTSAPNLTKPGITLGSPQYMSPEQVMGSVIDTRSDLYTLGLLTSELLVGHRPYRSEDGPASLFQHLEAAPEPAHIGNPAVSEAVSLVLLKALRKKPADRHPTVAAFIEELVVAARVGPIHFPERHSVEAMLGAISRVAPTGSSMASGVTIQDLMPTDETIHDLSRVPADEPRWTLEEPPPPPARKSSSGNPAVAPPDATRSHRKSGPGAMPFASTTPVPQRKSGSGTPAPGQRKSSPEAPALTNAPPPPPPNSHEMPSSMLTVVDLGPTDLGRKPPLPATVDERAPAAPRIPVATLITGPSAAWKAPASMKSTGKGDSDADKAGLIEVVATLGVVIAVVIAMAWVLL